MSDVEKIMGLQRECMSKLATPANEHAFHAAVTALASERDALRNTVEAACGAIDAAHEFGGPLAQRITKLIGQRDALRAENAGLRAALERIERWFGEFPATGKTWDNGEPMSYSAAYGSNGERDYMRQVARDALAAKPAAAPASAPAQGEPDYSFQQRVQPWMMACFGAMIAGDKEERNHRFLEEALELVQSCGCTAGEAHQLVDYVYSRPVGEPAQEVGGVMVTLAALCLAQGLDMHAAGETELARIWTKIEQIGAKQAAKPKHSPLPVAQGERASGEREAAFEAWAIDHEYAYRNPHGFWFYPSASREGMLPAFQAGAAWQARASVAPEAPLSEEFLPLLVRDLANEIGRPALDVCEAIRNLGLGNYSVNMAVGATLVRKVREHFAAQPEAPAIRESVNDAMDVVSSYGPWGANLNDAHRRQIVLADEVRRLQGLYESAVRGRADMRSALRAERAQPEAPMSASEVARAEADELDFVPEESTRSRRLASLRNYTPEQPEAPAPAPSREPTGPALSDADAAADLADAPRPGAAQYRARLTDAEIEACWPTNFVFNLSENLKLEKFARAVEAAVLAQPDRLAGWRFERVPGCGDIEIVSPGNMTCIAQEQAENVDEAWLHALASALIGGAK